MSETIEERLWYVLQVQPLHESIANAHLIGRRFMTYLPHVLRTTTRGPQRTKVDRLWPMFPGYLFIRLNWAVDKIDRVRTVPGVNRFLRLDDGYAIVPDVQLQRVVEVEKGELVPKVKVFGWDVGEQVRISEGPFSGINAEITKLDDEERIGVLLSLLGRAVRTTLPVRQLEKL